MSPPIRRLVVDVLKPHDPDVVEFAEAIAGGQGVDGVNAVVLETDREVQNCKFTVEGAAIDVDGVEETVGELGGSVHSIDEVVCGDTPVEQSDRPRSH